MSLPTTQQSGFFGTTKDILFAILQAISPKGHTVVLNNLQRTQKLKLHPGKLYTVRVYGDFNSNTVRIYAGFRPTEREVYYDIELNKLEITSQEFGLWEFRCATINNLIEIDGGGADVTVELHPGT